MGCTPCQRNRILSIISRIRSLNAAKMPEKDGTWITTRGTPVFIPKGKEVGDVIAEKFGTVTPDETKKIVSELKRFRDTTKEPRGKVFLTPDGEWIQLQDDDEHMNVIPAVAEKVMGRQRARNTKNMEYLSNGLVRAGFTPQNNTLYINSSTKLNSKQIEAIEIQMIKKGISVDNVRVDFNDESYERMIERGRVLKAVEYYKKDNTLYVKTFLIDDSRNRNGWRASWNSIKKNATSFVGQPGIEYTKCTKKGCMLDHTEGDTYDDSVHIQEKYRGSTIVDVVFDEDTHTAYAIHRVDNAELAKKIETKEIRYLSPSIWPNREKTTLYLSEKDEWHIDTTDWRGLHEAWVDQPAYGHKARVVGQCVGDDSCIVQLKQDKLLVARYLIARIRKRQQV